MYFFSSLCLLDIVLYSLSICNLSSGSIQLPLWEPSAHSLYKILKEIQEKIHIYNLYNTKKKKKKILVFLLFQCKVLFLEASSSSILLANDFVTRYFHHSLPLENDLSSNLQDAQWQQPLIYYFLSGSNTNL